MELSEANAKAKALYGLRAFCKINKQGIHDVCIDQSFFVKKKMHEVALLLGWGATWEDAFVMAAERAVRYDFEQQSTEGGA